MKSQEYIAGRIASFINPVYPLGDETIRRMASRAECRAVNRNTELCQENEVFNDFIWVSSGVFRLSRVIEEKDQTIAFGVEGDPFVSISSYLYDTPSLFSYQPLTDGEIISIPNAAMREIVEETEAVRWLNKVLFRQIHALENRYVWLGQTDAYSRYLRLIQLRPEIANQIPLKYIASYLGVTQSTLSRIRARIAGK